MEDSHSCSGASPSFKNKFQIFDIHNEALPVRKAFKCWAGTNPKGFSDTVRGVDHSFISSYAVYEEDRQAWKHKFNLLRNLEMAVVKYFRVSEIDVAKFNLSQDDFEWLGEEELQTQSIDRKHVKLIIGGYEETTSHIVPRVFEKASEKDTRISRIEEDLLGEKGHERLVKKQPEDDLQYYRSAACILYHFEQEYMKQSAALIKNVVHGGHPAALQEILKLRKNIKREEICNLNSLVLSTVPYEVSSTNGRSFAMSKFSSSSLSPILDGKASWKFWSDDKENFVKDIVETIPILSKEQKEVSKELINNGICTQFELDEYGKGTESLCIVPNETVVKKTDNLGLAIDCYEVSALKYHLFIGKNEPLSASRDQAFRMNILKNLHNRQLFFKELSNKIINEKEMSEKQTLFTLIRNLTPDNEIHDTLWTKAKAGAVSVHFLNYYPKLLNLLREMCCPTTRGVHVGLGKFKSLAQLSLGGGSYSHEVLSKVDFMLSDKLERSIYKPIYHPPSSNGRTDTHHPRVYLWREVDKTAVEEGATLHKVNSLLAEFCDLQYCYNFKPNPTPKTDPTTTPNPDPEYDIPLKLIAKRLMTGDANTKKIMGVRGKIAENDNQREFIFAAKLEATDFLRDQGDKYHDNLAIESISTNSLCAKMADFFVSQRTDGPARYFQRYEKPDDDDDPPSIYLREISKTLIPALDRVELSMSERLPETIDEALSKRSLLQGKWNITKGILSGGKLYQFFFSPNRVDLVGDTNIPTYMRYGVGNARVDYLTVRSAGHTLQIKDNDLGNGLVVTARDREVKHYEKEVQRLPAGKDATPCLQRYIEDTFKNMFDDRMFNWGGRDERGEVAITFGDKNAEGGGITPNYDRSDGYVNMTIRGEPVNQFLNEMAFGRYVSGNKHYIELIRLPSYEFFRGNYVYDRNSWPTPASYENNVVTVRDAQLWTLQASIPKNNTMPIYKSDDVLSENTVTDDAKFTIVGDEKPSDGPFEESCIVSFPKSNKHFVCHTPLPVRNVRIRNTDTDKWKLVKQGVNADPQEFMRENLPPNSDIKEIDQDKGFINQGKIVGKPKPRTQEILNGTQFNIVLHNYRLNEFYVPSSERLETQPVFPIQIGYLVKSIEFEDETIDLDEQEDQVDNILDIYRTKTIRRITFVKTKSFLDSLAESKLLEPVVCLTEDVQQCVRGMSIGSRFLKAKYLEHMGEQIQALDELHREKTGFSSAQFEVIQDYSKVDDKLSDLQSDMRQRVETVLSTFAPDNYQQKVTNLATENKNKYLITIHIRYRDEEALSAALAKENLFQIQGFRTDLTFAMNLSTVAFSSTIPLVSIDQRTTFMPNLSAKSFNFTEDDLLGLLEEPGKKKPKVTKEPKVPKQKATKKNKERETPKKHPGEFVSENACYMIHVPPPEPTEKDNYFFFQTPIQLAHDEPQLPTLTKNGEECFLQRMYDVVGGQDCLCRIIAFKDNGRCPEAKEQGEFTDDLYDDHICVYRSTDDVVVSDNVTLTATVPNIPLQHQVMEPDVFERINGRRDDNITFLLKLYSKEYQLNKAWKLVTKLIKEAESTQQNLAQFDRENHQKHLIELMRIMHSSENILSSAFAQPDEDDSAIHQLFAEFTSEAMALIQGL